MDNKAAIQDTVQAYLREQGWSVSQLARRVGIPQATLNRMLVPNDPTYRGDPDSWLKLARYTPLQLSPRDVLAVLWLEPHERTPSTDADPRTTILRALRALGVDALDQQAIMQFVRGAAARGRASRNAEAQ
jgi:hypothetical protein